jgi:signal transduction histidine kinase
MKTRNRIVLLFSAIIIGFILFFSGFLYLFVSRYAFMDFYKRLETRARYTARIRLDKDSHRLLHFRNDYLVKLPEEKDYVLEVQAQDSLDQLARNARLNTGLLEDIWRHGLGIYRNRNMLYCGIRYRSADGRWYIVITSARNYYFDELMNYLARLLVTLVLISALIILFISRWLYRRVLQPVRQITEEVNMIRSEHLSIRLKGMDSNDEIGELVRTMNGMMDRLETSFETQNNFISNASHELNTPLTAIIGEAEVALSRQRSVMEYQETLKSILSEAEKLDKKTKALLYLAQTGFNGKALKFKMIRIDQLIFDVQETVNKIYPENKVQIDFSTFPEMPESLKVNGNEQLLHLAFSNVILNACKYSRNEVVKISFMDTRTHVSVMVKDKGIGIPQNEISYIYDPFFRASNTANFEGYGIGLPLTRNIIRIHQGELLVSSEQQGGTLVEIRLPKLFPL